MSTKAVAWALEQPVGNAPAKLALIGYAEHAGRESWVAWPSRATIGAYAEVELRQAHRLHAYLLANGFIEEVGRWALTHEEQFRYDSLREDRRPKLWRLTGCQEQSPTPPARGDTSDTPQRHGVSSTPSRGVTEPANGVSSDDTRTVITKPSSRTAAATGEIDDEILNEIRTLNNPEPQPNDDTATVDVAELRRRLDATGTAVTNDDLAVALVDAIQDHAGDVITGDATATTGVIIDRQFMDDGLDGDELPNTEEE